MSSAVQWQGRAGARAMAVPVAVEWQLQLQWHLQHS